MAERVILGGKGSSLTSISVHAIANGLSQVEIDSSILEKLTSLSTTVNYRIPDPEKLTLEETRAFLVVFVNKLLITASTSSGVIRTDLPLDFVEILNSEKAPLPEGMMRIGDVDVTGGEEFVLKNSSASLYGICALLDYQSSALSVIADTVAAMSCEALKADVSVFNLMDSGDGFNLKDQTGVANDLKVLLNGSKLVGKVECDSVSEIPKVHGSLRQAVRLVHLITRVELNSGLKVGKGGSGSSGDAKALEATILSLASAILYVGSGSLTRAKLVLDSIGNDDLKLTFYNKCPSRDLLKKTRELISQSVSDEHFIKFMREVNMLVRLVWKIVIWEAIIAFFSLEGGSLRKPQIDEKIVVNNDKPERKGEKKKKVVLGKGTSVIVQLIKDKIESDIVDDSSMLKKLVEGFYAFLDPKDIKFDNLLKTIKEVVESNESRRLPKLAKGTRDFAKEQMAVRESAFNIITQVFKRHGAMALDTPVFELRETLMGKYGEDSKLIFDLADQGGELCSLRYDLTVPFARYVAMNGISSIKRYHIAKVYRRDNPSKGRFREFYQCDFDIAGSYETMGPDFEVIKILTELLDELPIGDYEVKLNHRKLLDGMLDICGVPPEKFRTICSSIDKLDKMSFEQIKKEMVEEKGLTADTAEMIGTFVKQKGSPLELLIKLKSEGSKFLENIGSASAMNELEILFKALEKSKCISKVVFDLSLARGLDYYTGVIYEAVSKGVTQVGSIAAGGRYDDLIGMFGTKQVPAVGVSLGIERVFAIMEEQMQKAGNQMIRATETQVLVSILGDNLSEAAELVSEFWAAGIKAEFGVNKRLTKHIDRAKASRIPWLVLVGERELTEGIVKLKEFETSKEEVIPRSNIVEELQRRLA